MFFAKQFLQRVFLALLMICLLQSLYGQKPDPGGDAHSNYLWFTAAKGVQDANGVYTWTDQASGLTVSNKTSQNPTYRMSDSSANYEPSFQFADSRLSSSSLSDSSVANAGAFFIVDKQSDSQITGFATSPFTSEPPSPFTKNEKAVLFSQDYTALLGEVALPVSKNPSPVENQIGMRNIYLQGDTIRYFYNGATPSSKPVANNFRMRYFGFTFGGRSHDRKHPKDFVRYAGSISECIIFKDSITELQRRKIVSYLALKYGITISSQARPTHYLASDGTTHMWNADEASSYRHNIAGIGRDDASGLHKIQSWSSALSGKLVEIQALGEGTNYTPAFSDMDNMEFLTWSHNNANLQQTNNDVPSKIAIRINREWKVQERGEVGPLLITFHISKKVLVKNALVTDFTLLVDEDGDFINGGTTLYPASGYSADTGVEFQNINLNGGQYFTLGTSRKPIKIAFEKTTDSGVESKGDNLPRLVISEGHSLVEDSVQISVNMASSSATAGVDYAPDFSNPITVKIPAGNYTTPRELTIPQLVIVNDVLVEPHETISLRLQQPSRNASLGTRTTTTYTITDDDALSVAFTRATGTGTENVGNNLPRLSESGEASTGNNLPRLSVSGGVSTSTNTVKVVLSITPGSATAGVDYTPDFSNPISVSIPAGDYSTAKELAIPGLSIVDDTDLEDDETLFLSLQSSTPQVVVGAQSTTVYTIIDDDHPPLVVLRVSDKVIGEARSKLIITAYLSNPFFEDVIIDLSFMGELSETEYTVSSDQIIIPSESRYNSITLTSLDDHIYEGDEELVIAIEDVEGGRESGDQESRVIVKDDDPLPKVTLSVNESIMRETGGKVILTASLDKVSGKEVVVNLSSQGKAMGEGVDYAIPTLRIVIPAGQNKDTLEVRAVSDKLDEGDEDIIFSISSVTGGEKKGEQKEKIIIEDDDALRTLSMAANVSSIDERGGEGVLTIALSDPSDFKVMFGLEVSGSVSESDYSLVGNAFMIPPGETSMTVFFSGVDDALREQEEEAIIKLVDVASEANVTIDPEKSNVKITLLDDDLLVVSEGFSPDGDGVNDSWHIKNIDKYPHNQVQIYNRWGEEVYREKGYDNNEKIFFGCSNKRVSLGTPQLPEGIYFYILNPGDGTKPMSGVVVIRR